MLASPLDPLPDLRKDFRPWSIFMRLWSAACHGRPLLLRKAELVTKIRQREQRTKNKAESQWQRQCGETQRPSWSQRPRRLCDTVFVTSSTFGQPQSFDNDRAQGQGLGARTDFVGFEFRTCWFSCWTESHSLGHPEAPRGDFDQISGTVVRLLARLQGAHLEVLRVGVPRFLFGGDDHMGPEGGFLRGWQTLRWRCELQQGSQEGLAARGRKEGPRATLSEAAKKVQVGLFWALKVIWNDLGIWRRRVRKAELVTKIRQREQRTKNKGRVTVRATMWWVTKAELVTKTVSQSAEPTLSLWPARPSGSPRVLTTTGPKDRASVQEPILWVLSSERVGFHVEPKVIASDTLRPHVVISTKYQEPWYAYSQDFKVLTLKSCE